MPPSYQRSVSLFDATMLIAGSMIGSGVFIVSADALRIGHSAFFLLAAWAVAAVLTVLAALSYGELAGMYPRAGGQYTYLREIYGPFVGFLYGWTFFAVIECGTIAAVAVGFGKYLGSFVPWVSDEHWLVGPLEVGPFKPGLSTARLAAVLIIVVLSAVNRYGVKLGTRVQNVFTVAKIGSLIALIALGLLLRPTTAPDSSDVPGPLPLPWIVGLLVAQTGTLFSADAWNSVTFIAGELRRPEKDLPRALILGTGLVCALYILANVVYLRLLGPQAIASAPSDRVGARALEALFGSPGSLAMSAAILVSMFGCVNGLVLSGARVYQTMAEHGLFLAKARELNAHGVPGNSLAVQALWASALSLSGSYSQLLDYVIFAALLFYVLTVAGVIVQRWRTPETHRPYRVPLILPVLYLAGASTIMAALLVYRPTFTWPGLGIVALGIPLYQLRKRGATGDREGGRTPA